MGQHHANKTVTMLSCARSQVAVVRDLLTHMRTAPPESDALCWYDGSCVPQLQQVYAATQGVPSKYFASDLFTLH